MKSTDHPYARSAVRTPATIGSTMSNALDVYMHCNSAEMQAYLEKVEPMSIRTQTFA